MIVQEDQLHNATLCDGRTGIRAMLQVSCSLASRSLSVSEGSPAPSTDTPVLEFIASTAALDRYGEIIEPEGWKLDSYRKNPVFLNAHRYGDVLFTLGKATGVEVREVEGRKALCLRVEFATEVNPIARVAYGLYKGGFLKAVSVGFIPLRWLDGNEKTEWRRRYIEQELLEVSAVAIPANHEALQMGLRSGAVTKADLAEALDILSLATSGSIPSAKQPTVASPARTSQLSTLNSQLSLARELRRIMRA